MRAREALATGLAYGILVLFLGAGFAAAGVVLYFAVKLVRVAAGPG